MNIFWGASFQLGGGGGLVAKQYLTLCDPMDYSPPGSSVHGIFSRQEYWSGSPFPLLGDLPNPEIEPESPSLGQAGCLSLCHLKKGKVI